MMFNCAVQALGQPLASVADTLYDPRFSNTASKMLMLAPVALNPFGPVQLNRNGGVPPVTAAVNVAEPPRQISAAETVIAHTGTGLTTSSPEQLVEHPFESVILAKYVPAAPTVIVGPLALNPPGPFQTIPKGAVPLVTFTVNVAEPPSQIS